MELEPIWFEYAIFDDDGELTGIREDAPQDAKDAYAEYVAEVQGYIDRGEPIPR